MIKYLEYIYLVAAFGLLFFLATSYKELSTGNMVVMVVGILISSFMFSFRRKQRQVMEAEDRRLEELEDENNENGD